ncbi:MAG: hypothetical protein HND51_18240 [Chloroflexi bacterium]|nr:hypothetical protein [Chloroflexota bacterium]
MNITPIKLAGISIAFLVIFFFGFWLSRSGKPYNAILFNFHKLIALATLIFLGISVYRINLATPLGTATVALAVLTGAVFLGTMVTGGLLNLDTPMPAALTVVHHIAPYLTVLATALTLYLVLNRVGIQRLI